MNTYPVPQPDRSAPWSPGRSTATPAYRIPDGDTVGEGAASAYRAEHAAPVEPERWPSTFERVLYAVAATVTICVQLLIAWTIYEMYLFVDRVGDAMRQLGDGLGGLGG